MADEKNKWWRRIVTIGGDAIAAITGGALGAKWAETNIKTEILKQAGNEVKQHFTPNREEVMKELLLLGEDGADIVTLLEEANQKRFIKCRKKRYPENWIINMLLKVKPKDRQWVYTLLNESCKNDRCKFFTFLEILCNDGLTQYLHIAKEMAKDLLKNKEVKNLRSMIAKPLKRIDREAGRVAQGINQKNAEFDRRRNQPLVNFRRVRIPKFHLYK